MSKSAGESAPAHLLIYYFILIFLPPRVSLSEVTRANDDQNKRIKFAIGQMTIKTKEYKNTYFNHCQKHSESRATEIAPQKKKKGGKPP
jgi:hypothetical protein